MIPSDDAPARAQEIIAAARRTADGIIAAAQEDRARMEQQIQVSLEEVAELRRAAEELLDHASRHPTDVERAAAEKRLPGRSSLEVPGLQLHVPTQDRGQDTPPLR